MVKRILTLAAVAIGCLSIGATHYRGYSELTLMPQAAAGLMDISPYCDGRYTLFINSGSGDVVLTTPSDVFVGARCRVVIAVDLGAVVMASFGDIYGDDGSTLSNIGIVSGDSSYGAALTMVEFESGKWTVDQMYGEWVLNP